MEQTNRKKNPKGQQDLLFREAGFQAALSSSSEKQNRSLVADQALPLEDTQRPQSKRTVNSNAQSLRPVQESPESFHHICLS